MYIVSFLQIGFGFYWVYNIVITTKTYYIETKKNKDRNKSNSNPGANGTGVPCEALPE